MTFFVHVARVEGERQKVYGPFDTHEAAFEYGTPFAQEGLDVEIQTSDVICDFCSRPEVAWSYPARDFGVVEPDLGWGSRGSWAACQGCYELIQKSNAEALAKRSLENFNFESHGVPDSEEAQKWVYRAVRVMHGSFFAVRTGPPIPVEKP